MTIKILDPKVVSRIAAGEVVERPSSVVKELVENSLDAGADQISVEVRGGGVSLIRVTDNGAGIPSGEVALAFERHATSKIGKLEDLGTISSLGFRGEALPSIAAVAQVEVVTCVVNDAAGSFIVLKDGEVVERGSRGRTRGTTITVKNLFKNVPARLKFLKSLATENGRIASVVSQYALAFPEVRFALSIDGRTSLKTAGSGRLLDSITQVYGAEIAGNMLDVDSQEGEWQGGTAASPRITGMAGSPAVSRSSRGYISFFVNRRWVSSRLLAWAVEEAYHGLLMVGKHPVAAINIFISPDEVDVNIHPAKNEVKFRDERLVFGAVQRAVRRSIIGQLPVPGIEEISAPYRASAVSRQLPWTRSADADSGHSLRQPSQEPLVSLPVLRVLGQLQCSYIVAEGPDGLYLIDQHAAHERVVYERVMEQRSRRGAEVQGLLEPATIEVNPGQDEALKAHGEKLGEFGFIIEAFGDRTYLVRTVPATLYSRDWMGTLREALDSLGGDGRSGDWVESMAISIACHGAIRAGQALSDDEMRRLLRELEQTTVPHACPHGRPTMIHLGLERLSREFGRG